MWFWWLLHNLTRACWFCYGPIPAIPCCLYGSSSEPGWFLSPPGEIWQCLETFFVVTTGKVGATGMYEYMPEMLLHILHGKSLTRKNYLAKNLRVLKVRDPELRTTVWVFIYVVYAVKQMTANRGFKKYLFITSQPL